MQAYTLYSSVRPFGSAAILGVQDHDGGFHLYMMEPSGQSYGYTACVVGAGKQSAKAALEKLNFAEMDVTEAAHHAGKMFSAYWICI